MAASHYELDNLVAIIDRNLLQQGDFTERTMHLEPLADKWRAFGWTVCELDGHDHSALLAALRGVPFEDRAAQPGHRAYPQGPRRLVYARSPGMAPQSAE